MSDANGASKRDFTAGIPFQDLQDGVPLAGRAGDEDVILVRRGREAFADWRALHSLSRPARRRPGRRRHGPLSLASRLLQPADGRGAARARARRDRVLPGRAQRRHGLRPGEAARPAEAPAARDACLDRHRRRRRGRARGGRHAAPRGLRRTADDDQRRQRSAGGPAQPVEGLPGRHGEGRLDSAARARVLRGAAHRSAPRLARHQSGCRRQATASRRRQHDALRRAADRDRRRPGASHHSRRLGLAGALPAQLHRQQGDRRRRRIGQARRRDWRQLHRARSGGVAARARHRRARRCAGRPAARARHGR